MSKDKGIKYYTYELNMTLLNIMAMVLFIVVGGLVWFLERGDTYVIHLDTISLLIGMFFYLVLHELLHGIGFGIFRSVRKENIIFGMFLEKGVFYCMCKQKIGKRIILTSLLFPLVVIGIVTLMIGMIWNQYELVFFSILNITSAIGDMVMTVYFWKAPSDIVYLDLDDCTSFTVLSSQDLSQIVVPGILLKETGVYDAKTMYSKDKRRVVISKASYILVILIFILILIKIIVGGIL